MNGKGGYGGMPQQAQQRPMGLGGGMAKGGGFPMRAAPQAQNQLEQLRAMFQQRQGGMPGGMPPQAPGGGGAPPQIQPLPPQQAQQMGGMPPQAPGGGGMAGLQQAQQMAAPQAQPALTQAMERTQQPAPMYQTQPFPQPQQPTPQDQFQAMIQQRLQQAMSGAGGQPQITPLPSQPWLRR